MAYYTGTGAAVQIGKEAAFGEAVAPTTLLDLTSESISVTVEKGDEGSMLASKTPQSRDLLSITTSGSISFILKPEFAGLLFHLALGGADAVSALEDGRYKHVFHLCDANVELPSFTTVVDRKAAVKKYSGCTISALSLDAAAGDYVKGSIDLQGVKESAGVLTAGLGPFTIPSFRCTSATFKVDGEVFDISSASLKIDNALEAAPKTYSTGLYAGQPLHGKRSVTISFEIPYSEKIESVKDTYLTTETNAEVVLTFASSNADYTVEVKIPKFSVNEVSANVGGTGVLTATVGGEALSVGNTEPLEIVLTDYTETAYGG